MLGVVLERSDDTWWVSHVGLDESLAAVEIARRPELRGRSVVVGKGDPTERAVVATASSAARECGNYTACHSTTSSSWRRTVDWHTGWSSTSTNTPISSPGPSNLPHTLRFGWRGLDAVRGVSHDDRWAPAPAVGRHTRPGVSRRRRLTPSER
jgi:hypothetical protein